MELASHWADFHESLCISIFRKSVIQIGQEQCVLMFHEDERALHGKTNIIFGHISLNSS